jgi:hypothetical protein
MKKPGLLIVIIMKSVFISCENESKNEQTNQFAGLWSLYQMEFYNPQTKEWNELKSEEKGYPDGIQGYISYDNTNHMSVHLVPRGYENTDLEFPTLIDSISNDAIEHLASNYIYFANYSINEEESIIEHNRVSHSNPELWNESVKRKYTFKGDTLTLEPLEASRAGTRLRWIKVSNAND